MFTLRRRSMIALFILDPLNEAWRLWIFGNNSEAIIMMVSSGSLKTCER